MRTTVTGVVTSLITPFSLRLNDEGHFDATLDEFHFQSLVRWQADAGVSAVAVSGWIGEGPTLSAGERSRLIELAVEASRGRLAVLAHVGSSDTARSVDYATDAAAAGANALVVVAPFYNSPNAAGFRAHVDRVARSTSLPVYVEFDTARTRVSLSIYEMVEMMRIDGVVGIIDHSANPMHVECLSACKRPMAFFAAHEPSCVASCLFGADGFFSAVANIAPSCVLQMQEACQLGDFDRARRIHERLLPLTLLVEEEGVAALKYAMHPELGLDPAVRLPLVPLPRPVKARVKDAMAAIQPAQTHAQSARRPELAR